MEKICKNCKYYDPYDYICYNQKNALILSDMFGEMEEPFSLRGFEDKESFGCNRWKEKNEKFLYFICYDCRHEWEKDKETKKAGDGLCPKCGSHKIDCLAF